MNWGTFLVAILAAMSAVSFPGICLCPGIHSTVTSYLKLRSSWNRVWSLCIIWLSGFMVCSPCTALKESVQIRYLLVVISLLSSLMRVHANISAFSSAVYTEAILGSEADRVLSL